MAPNPIPHLEQVLLLLFLSVAVPLANASDGGETRPAPDEEEIRWNLNRARWSPADENVLRRTNYGGLPPRAAPLAHSDQLLIAARKHSDDMARSGFFQHQTVPGSAYYNPATQPEFWDRIDGEGYNWFSVGENISGGYGTALNTYLSWWTSQTGHRQNMTNPDYLEIGTGSVVRAGSRYGDYSTMDLGNRGRAFFTGTTFFDENQNGSYDAGEGIDGLELRLLQGATIVSADSGASGDFQLSLAQIATGQSVTLEILNQESIRENAHLADRFLHRPRPCCSRQFSRGCRNVRCSDNGVQCRSSGSNHSFTQSRRSKVRDL